MREEIQELRPFQLEALSALKKDQHVLCVAPTGSGKSLIYERMTVSLGCRMLLVTPLVALARQQESRLKALGVRVHQGTGGGGKGPPLRSETGAWIVSPETLDRSSRQEALSRWNPNLMVVDECHCLWEWGESFRPAFLLLPPLLQKLQLKQSLWLTATLPPEARKQMQEFMPQPFVELGKFSLPSTLEFEVKRVPWEIRSEYLLERIQKCIGAGIIFVSTREGAVRIARLVTAIGKKVLIYHAGMGSEERRAVEKQIAARQVEVVVATSAFGMGMDYPFLNWVILWQSPLSLLSLAQAIGRVGRNSTARAMALVLWDEEDFRMMEWSALRSSRACRELEILAQFLRTEGCRSSGLENYFNGGSYLKKCGQCDFCELFS